MKYLHLDCSSGMSGDMFLAALTALGYDISILQKLFRASGLPIALRSEAVNCHGLSGSKLSLTMPERRPLRHLRDIVALVGSLELDETVRLRSLSAFRRLAEIEAAVHDCSPGDVHFHEVGAMDTVVNVVGAFAAIRDLGIVRVTCSALPWFSGEARTTHGIVALPAPATLRLLQGKPVYPTDFRREIITPTGALLLDQLVDEFQPGPHGMILASGTGFGSLDLAPAPNGLRAVLYAPDLGTASGPDGVRHEDIVVLESNIDHLTGEELGACFEALLAAGAVDVMFVPGLMKKNRPGGMLQAMCRPADLALVRQTYFKHTLSLGVRIRPERRVVLERRPSAISTPLGLIPGKSFELEGRAMSRPEFDALKALAARTGRSVPELRMMIFGEDVGEDA